MDDTARTSSGSAADDLYALLRRTGEVTVLSHDKSLMGRMRTRARRDGLATTQCTPRGQRSRYAGTPRTTINLIDPANPDYIVRPDADKVA